MIPIRSNRHIHEFCMINDLREGLEEYSIAYYDPLRASLTDSRFPTKSFLLVGGKWGQFAYDSIHKRMLYSYGVMLPDPYGLKNNLFSRFSKPVYANMIALYSIYNPKKWTLELSIKPSEYFQSGDASRYCKRMQKDTEMRMKALASVLDAETVNVVIEKMRELDYYGV